MQGALKMRSYYGNYGNINQMRGLLTRPTAGLNEYTPANDITENHLSDCLDVSPVRNSALKFYAPPTTTDPVYEAIAEMAGLVYESLSDSDSTSEHLYMLLASGSGWYVVKADLTSGPITRYDVSTQMGSITTPDYKIFTGCLFATEAAKYVCFACNGADKIVYLNITAGTVGVVALDFTPKKIVSHVNRIFVIDDANVLWWSKAGDLTSWYGTIGSDSFVNRDAGYWTIESERYLSEICVLNNNLYIFGLSNIYIFRGYSYSTFSLDMIISNVGIRAAHSSRLLTTVNNKAYFISTEYSTTSKAETPLRADIYEFDGSSMPKVISRPVITNGGSVNGVFGGIYNESLTYIVADENFLYVYDRDHVNTEDEDTYYYAYDMEQKTWWKFSGFNEKNLTVSDDFRVIYVPTSNRSMCHAVVSNKDTGYTFIFDVMGAASNNVPYLITKAFNTAPSEDGTLTAIILQVKGTKDKKATITISYNLTVDGTTFTTIKQYADYTFTGDVETIEVPVPVAYIARSRFYRIKVAISSVEVYLYNIERRFRVIGRSR